MLIQSIWPFVRFSTKKPSAAFSDDLDFDSGSAEKEGTDDEKQTEEIDRALTLSLNIQFIVEKV